MKISSTSKNIAFTSNPIHEVNLKKVTNGVEDGTIKAIFSKLDVENPLDLKAVEQIKNTWDDGENLLYSLFRHFKEKKVDNDFYAIEMPGEGPLSERIVGILNAEFIPNEKIYRGLTINTKQPSGNIANGVKIKGTGEVLNGEVINMAKEKDAEKFDFISLADSFYKHTFDNAKVSIPKDAVNPNYYSVTRDKFDKYIEYCRTKYGNNFSTII